MLLLWICLCLAVSAARAQNDRRPHIVQIMVDDFGWAEVGYHNWEAKLANQVATPNIDALVAEGLELDRFYTEKIWYALFIHTGSWPCIASTPTNKPSHTPRRTLNTPSALRRGQRSCQGASASMLTPRT